MRVYTERLLAGVAALAVLIVLAGCGISIPADPEGTLERVRGGTMRVGVSPNEPWTELNDNSPPSGIEVDLVEGFAESLGARIEWSGGGEESLMEELRRGELDLVIGGLTSKSPWTDKAAITKPYAEAENEAGKQEKLVMAARMGENAFLLALERFLLEQEVQP
jgi:polar amino acid transport system substrate-binding protein